MTSTDFYRVFLAVTPDAAVLDRVETSVSELKREITARNVKWEAPSKWHITLRFLGNVPIAVIPEMCTSLEARCASRAPFIASARGFGAFPSLRRPRILWAGVDDPSGNLLAVQKDVTEATLPFVPEVEDRRFHPHLTIARIREEQRKSSTLIANSTHQRAEVQFGSWSVDRVELWRSTLQPGGSQYELLAEFPFLARN